MIAAIGFDPPIFEALKAKLGHLVEYPMPPERAFAADTNGRFNLESWRTPGKFLQPDAVLWYSYFFESTIPEVRRALALSSTPSFPDVRQTIQHDDKVMSLIRARTAEDGVHGRTWLNRGYISPTGAGGLPDGLVLKWGNSHCGDNKRLSGAPEGSDWPPEGMVLVEPFVKGESHRILVVGDHTWELVYTSSDWRKNVGGQVEIIHADQKHFNNSLAERGRALASELGLNVVGIDYIGSNENGWNLLEVNAYPSLDEAPGAIEAFVELAVERLG